MTNCIHVDKHAVGRNRGLYSVYSLASLQLNFVFAVLFCFQAHSAVSQLKAVTCTHLRRPPWLNYTFVCGHTYVHCQLFRDCDEIADWNVVYSIHK